jgi:hypothetical protein
MERQVAEGLADAGELVGRVHEHDDASSSPGG